MEYATIKCITIASGQIKTKGREKDNSRVRKERLCIYEYLELKTKF